MADNLDRLRTEVNELNTKRRSLRPTSELVGPLTVSKWSRAEQQYQEALQAYKVARWNRRSQLCA